MKRTIIFSISVLLISSIGASACIVGKTVTRANFIKLTGCVNNLETSLAKAQNDLTTAISALQSEISAMKGATKIAAIRKTDGAVPDAGSYGGFSGTLSTDNPAVQCPPGSWVSGIQGFKVVISLPAAVSPIAELRYTCRGLTR
jgi:hypothetical protein